MPRNTYPVSLLQQCRQRRSSMAAQARQAGRPKKGRRVGESSRICVNVARVPGAGQELRDILLARLQAAVLKSDANGTKLSH